ncbi:MAG: 2-oxoacid:acceptor oxidoreductase family protein [Thermoprotei archaeon]|nr:2-oxoacid:acceptor oxidoreductase family protein [Thermoprotei archaeon]
MGELKLRIIGAGGHGILLAGNIIGTASILSGRDAVMTIAYSPAQRGGWSRADVIVSDERIDFPIFDNPDVLIATTQETYELEVDNVIQGGIVIYERDLVSPRNVPYIKQVPIPAFETAIKLGFRMSANMVILGFVNEFLKILSHEAMINGIKARVKRRLDVNIKAYEMGVALARGVEP